MGAAETLGGKSGAPAGTRVVRHGKWLGGPFLRNPIESHGKKKKTPFRVFRKIYS